MEVFTGFPNRLNFVDSVDEAVGNVVISLDTNDQSQKKQRRLQHFNVSSLLFAGLMDNVPKLANERQMLPKIPEKDINGIKTFGIVFITLLNSVEYCTVLYCTMLTIL